MRGSLTDFYASAPVAPVIIDFMPPDFNPVYIDFYAQQPLAPEIIECQRCEWQRCNALVRAAGRTLKPDCAAFLVMDAAPAPVKLRLTPEQARAAIIATLRAGGVMTLYEIQAAADLSYASTRHHLEWLLAAGAVVGAGWRNTGTCHRGQARLYALPERKPADARERPPRKPRRSNPAQERSIANDKRIVATLRMGGPLTAVAIAEACALSAASVRDKLILLAAQGRVRQAGCVTVMCGRDNATPRKAALWTATEE